MKYYVVEFAIHAVADVLSDARDVLSAMLGEAGFETFEETEGGLRGYVQQSLFDSSMLDDVLTCFPFADATVEYQVNEAEDRDWNEQWEKEGFEPIVVERLVIHDGRHLPSQPTTAAGIPASQSPLAIEIDTHMAFGTGNHETTRMVCAQLLSLPLEGSRVLDCGTGTGILAILALKLGAREAVGYDIDEWSVDNARHNAVINGVDGRFTSLHGDASLLGGRADADKNKVEGPFDVVVANINRNILLHDLPAFVRVAAPRATIVLSGFFRSDVDILSDQASALGLSTVRQQSEGDWACLVLRTNT